MVYVHVYAAMLTGQLGKYQNGRIKEIGRIARCGKEMSGVPDLASSYCVPHAVHILIALPTKANPTDGRTTIMLTKQTKMSRLRHVCIFVMQVTS